ncbi:MAG: hypothetical protein ACI4A3_13640 [Lachnospiraceae bacterium]
MQRMKKGFKYILTFLAITALLTGVLVLSAMIPRSLIRENVQESAVYLCEGELFGKMVKNVKSSEIDRYADSILLGIAYQYDSDKPLTSVMWSNYYHNALYNENENLLTAVTDDCEANQQYLRYWHGSNAIVRSLLTVLNLKQIYILNGIVLALLVICLLSALLREKAYIPAVGVAAGLIMTSVWFVPLSLEYTWTYLLMLLMSIIGIRLMVKRRYKAVGLFFLISGMLTNYLDFLTTETLTLTVPLLLMVWIEQRQNEKDTMKPVLQITGKAVAAWSFGYAGLWMMKWFLASVVLSQNVMPYVSEHIDERVGAGSLRYIFGAIWNNIKCIFPFEYGIIGVIVGIGLVMSAIYTGYVYHGKNIDRNSILLYLLMGMIPYIRYVVLHNHSYIHCFFTYRAQMATILAAVMILGQLTAGVWPIHKNKRKMGRGRGHE